MKINKDMKVLLGVIILVLVFVFLQENNENFRKISDAGGRCEQTVSGNYYKCREEKCDRRGKNCVKTNLKCVNKKCVKP